MTHWQERAHRLRHLILVLGLLLSLGGIGWVLLPFLDLDIPWGDNNASLLGTPLTLGKLCQQDEFGAGVNIAIVFGAILLAQWAFLRPRRGWSVRLAAEGRPLTSAVIGAALMASLLTIGAGALVLELPNWWEPIMGGANDDYGWKEGRGLIVVWAVMAAAWAAWALIFLAYWRQEDHHSGLGKMLRALITASLLEAFVAVPVHVWATRQRECYCCRGTYTTLVLAGTVLLWAFGPGIILLYWRERYRRARLMMICSNCGYDLRGTVAAGREACPECDTRIGRGRGATAGST